MSEASDKPASATIDQPAAKGCDRRLLVVTATALVVLVGLWLLDIRGGGVPELLSRLSVLAAAGSLAVLIVHLVRRAVTGSDRRAARILLALLALAAAVRIVGIDHEVEERYYLDEGTYYHHATEINKGEVFRARFVYPHLSYYLYAVVLWVASLFPAAVNAMARGLFGVEEAIAVQWLLMRGTVAILSALTVIPLFHFGRRLQGLFVAVTGSLLFIFSPLFNEGSHLLISDAPAAILATFALCFAYRLVERESLGDYLLAGGFAGLAAATKYPAGVVAVAIVAVWLGWRLRRRDWSWSLLWAGLVSIAAFVTVMPSLLVYPRQAFTGGQGIFFGVRQYAGGGWIGVMPSSNTAYYARHLAISFGLPLLVLSLLGLFLLQRDLRRRLIWLLPFPTAYLLLVGSMNMVVKRNLFPAVPALAVLLAAGLYGLWRTAGALPRGRAFQIAILAAALTLPTVDTSLQTIALARPGTRVVAREWIRQHLPRGAFVVKDSYTPRLAPVEYLARQARFVARLGLDELRQEQVDVIMVSSSAYGRFFDAERFKPHHEELRETYQNLFDAHQLVHEVAPSRTRTGPLLRIYRGGPLQPEYRTERAFQPGEAFLPDHGMAGEATAAEGTEGTVHFDRPGQWCSFKGYFAAGIYRVEIARDTPPGDAGSLEVVSFDNQLVATLDLEGALAELSLPSDGKYWLRLRLPVGSVLRSLQLTPGGPVSPPEDSGP